MARNAVAQTQDSQDKSAGNGGGAPVGGMNVRRWLALVGLACAAFVFNTSEFVPVGLLTDIAASFALTEAQAGMMISIYAWGVMILSLPLMIVASKLEYRKLLLVVLVVFLAGQVASALAPTFPLLVMARLLVACAHAVFWSIASTMASRVADARHGALALSMVATGSSIAQVLGMPLGRIIGLALGWRMTFTCVGAISLVILLFLGAFMPRLEKGEPFTVRQLPQLFKNPMLVAMYGVTVLVATGYYTGYSYIEPFMQQIGGLDANTVTLALTVFGLAGIVGSFLFSRFYDGHRVGFVRIMVFGVAAALALMGMAVFGPAAAFGVCALWGVCATAFNVAFQAEIIHVTKADESAVATSIFSGLFNLGIGCGSWFGGMVTTVAGLSLVGPVGAAFALVGFVLCMTLLGRAHRAA